MAAESVVPVAAAESVVPEMRPKKPATTALTWPERGRKAAIRFFPVAEEEEEEMKEEEEEQQQRFPMCVRRRKWKGKRASGTPRPRKSTTVTHRRCHPPGASRRCSLRPRRGVQPLLLRHTWPRRPIRTRYLGNQLPTRCPVRCHSNNNNQRHYS